MSSGASGVVQSVERLAGAGAHRHLLTGCTSSDDCTSATDGRLCISGATCGCAMDSDCTAWPRTICSGVSSKCGCNTNSDCPYFPICSNNKCSVCDSDDDCPFLPQSDSGEICIDNPDDLSVKMCGCAVNTDCNPGGRTTSNFCFLGFCKECASSSDCSDPEKPICHSGKYCVQCELTADCTTNAKGHECVNGVCGCILDTDCSASRPICDGDSICQECVNNTHCVGHPNGDTCNLVDNKCVWIPECWDDADCLGEPTPAKCNLTNLQCYEVECLNNTNCVGNPDGDKCNVETSQCIDAECFIDADCVGNPNGPICDTDIFKCSTAPSCDITVVDAAPTPACPLPYLVSATFNITLNGSCDPVTIDEADFSAKLAGIFFGVPSCQLENQVSTDKREPSRRLLALPTLTDILFQLSVYAPDMDAGTRISDRLFDPMFAVFLAATLGIPLDTILEHLAVQEPVISLLVSGSSDPHFVNARGDKFDFYGAAGASYCVFTQERLHVNARLMGAFAATTDAAASSSSFTKSSSSADSSSSSRASLSSVSTQEASAAARATLSAAAAVAGSEVSPPRHRQLVDRRTWMDAVGILHAGDRVLVEAASPPGTAYTDAGGRIYINGKELLGKFAHAKLPSGVSVSRSKTRVTVSVPGITVINIEVVRAAFWDVGKGPGANFINLSFKETHVTQNVHGILGQSFTEAATEPFEGVAEDYVTSGVFAADCRVNRYGGN
eukprot:jgi/Mesvir1/23036/Mv03028-RA.1